MKETVRMPWYKYLGVSSWGKALEILVTIFMAALTFYYAIDMSLAQRLIWTGLIAFVTWCLAWMVHVTCVWIGDSLKKE